MKDYSLNSTHAKRFVQDKLFTNFSLAEKQELTGLAGSNPVVAYLQYQKHLSDQSNITLIDINSFDPNIRRIDIVYAKPTYIMDVDLEVSIVNGISTIKRVFDNMNEFLIGTKILCFTLSTRCIGGRQRTIECLNKHLYNQTLNVLNFDKIEIGIRTRYVQHLIHTQTAFTFSDLYCYKDSSHMLSGIIVWK